MAIAEPVNKWRVFRKDQRPKYEWQWSNGAPAYGCVWSACTWSCCCCCCCAAAASSECTSCLRSQLRVSMTPSQASSSSCANSYEYACSASLSHTLELDAVRPARKQHSHKYSYMYLQLLLYMYNVLSRCTIVGTCTRTRTSTNTGAEAIKASALENYVRTLYSRRKQVHVRSTMLVIIEFILGFWDSGLIRVVSARKYYWCKHNLSLKH